MTAAHALEVSGVIRRYDWGSHTAIQSMLGEPADGRPAAELWFGDHPGDPSPAGDATLDRLVAADPVAVLGADAVARFGAGLPFLLKVLAARHPLSIQVHPDLGQARAGFAAEQAAGIAIGAPERTYSDANHKPELLCALSEFEALCGFRPVAATVRVLDEIALPELAFLPELLRGPDGLRAAFSALLRHERPAVLAEAVSAAATEHGPLRPAYLAARAFPGDIGIVLSLLLNHVTLAPGEAIYLGAGNVHAYLRGTGVEIMASSDNVLRCGLTSKHVDVAELLRVADFSVLDDPVRKPDRDGFDDWFRVPVPDFALGRVDIDAYGTGDGTGGSLAFGGHGPLLVLCTDGHAFVGRDDARVALLPGHAAFVPAGERACAISGTGTVFLATTAAGAC